MTLSSAPLCRLIIVCMGATLLAGCMNVFSPRGAKQVSRDRLLQICERGPIDHLRYMGTESGYHYLYETLPGKERTYKIAADAVKLADTFPVGADSYPLYPWTVEGKLLGSKPEKEVGGAP